MTLPALVDDMSRPFPEAATGARWEYVADTVMGGVSSGGLARDIVAGRPANRLTGRVSLDNNGGFVQMALDLAADGRPVDASAWTGVALDVFGNGETYNLHLRTSAVTRPWQSYRASFTAQPRWQTVAVAFSDLSPHRLEAPFDARSLRRIGLVAIGREMTADLAMGGVRFYL